MGGSLKRMAASFELAARAWVAGEFNPGHEAWEREGFTVEGDKFVRYLWEIPLKYVVFDGNVIALREGDAPGYVVRDVRFLIGQTMRTSVACEGMHPNVGPDGQWCVGPSVAPLGFGLEGLRTAVASLATATVDQCWDMERHRRYFAGLSNKR